MPVDRTVADDLAGSLSNLYADAERRLAADIARRLAAGMSSPTWAKDKLAAVGDLRRWTQVLLRQLETDARHGITQSLLLAYVRGGTEANREMARVQNTLPQWVNRAGIDPGPAIQRALNGRRSELDVRLAKLTRAFPGLAAVQRVIGSLALRITGTHLPVLRWAEDAYRQTIAAGALPDVLMGTATRRRASQVAWEKLLGQGITGFTDKANRRWNLASYVEMATRTGVAQAAVEGHLDRLADAGLDLVIVSNAPQECERCRPWEGKVLSRGGPSGRRTVQVLSAISDQVVDVEIRGTVDDAVKAGLLHPNCRHSLSAYLPGATRIPTNTEDPEGDKARQHLRALERDVRKAKLQQAGALTPEAAKAAEDKIRAKQAAIRDHVAATEHLGIMRKPEREQLNLGNSSGLDAGKQVKAPKPTPGPKPKPTPAATPAAAKRAAGPQSVRIEGRDRLDEVMRDSVEIYGRPQGDHHWDEPLGRIGARQGFNGHPQVVTPDQMDAAVKSGWTETWRGVQAKGNQSAAQIAERLRTGPYEPGKGIYGNGIYTSERRATAVDFSASTPSGMMRIAIDPAAHIVDYDDLKKEFVAWRRRLPNRGKLTFDQLMSYPKNTEDGAAKLFSGDIGRYAAARGIDVIRIGTKHEDGAEHPRGEKRKPQYNILNRSVLMIEKAVK